ncbi:MAG TPA: ATP-binding protein [Actinomycetota bacterium]|nr:ATP-binding protein [Actinomycetota bacterium]
MLLGVPLWAGWAAGVRGRRGPARPRPAARGGPGGPEAIRQGSAGAMQELRAALGVLRDPGGRPARAPAPGLGQLAELVAGVAGAGRTVEVVVEGDPGELPPAADLAAYRVVQESLTNVVKHAGPATATVRVAYEPGQVTVEVTDNGMELASDGMESASG